MASMTFMIVGGYLGAGKTTTMIALAKELEARKVNTAVIANDLGARDLVDADYSETHGLSVTPIGGGCICYQTETLVDKLRNLRDRKNKTFVMSDIPGCGIGGLDHVYHALDRDYRDEFLLAPFVAIADPERLRVIMPEHADINLPEEMAFLFDAQLKEADVIVLNKVDMVDAGTRRQAMDFLEKRYAPTPVFAISAKTGEGIDDLADFLLSHSSNLAVQDIGYGSDAFNAAEATMSWYNRRFFVKRTDGQAFDGNSYVTQFIESVRGRLIAAHRNAPHLKVFAVGRGNDFAKASLVGVDYPIDFDHNLAEPVEGLRVVVNVRATCESKLLGSIMDGALEETMAAFELEGNVFFTECFGMADEGL